jgi:hypothetical protein
MASRGKKSGAYQALQALMALPGSHNDIWTDLTAKLFDDPMDRMGRFLAATPEYDDRAAAIVFGALVEHSLEAALTTYFDIEADNASKLFTYSEDEGRISTFSAKIALGAALGVYDHRMRHDLTWVKNIQNAFAHARVYVDFKTEAIILACDQLRFPAKRKPEDSPPVAKVAVTRRQRSLRLQARWQPIYACRRNAFASLIQRPLLCTRRCTGLCHHRSKHLTDNKVHVSNPTIHCAVCRDPRLDHLWRDINLIIFGRASSI